MSRRARAGGRRLCGPAAQQARARGAHDGWHPTRAEPRARRHERDREIRRLEAYLRRETIKIYAEAAAIIVVLLLLAIAATLVIHHGR